MRYWGLWICLLAWPLAAQEEPEIVIELTGAPPSAAAADGINVWNKNAKQLEKLLRGKTREEALYQITSVSTKDASVRAADGTRYRLVQYGREGGYRKLLFRAQDPQTFVAAAADTSDSLALFARYRVDIGITETEFLNTYAREAAAVFLPLADGKSLYQLTLKKTQAPQFFLFEQGVLQRTLSQSEADELVQAQQKTANTQPPAAQKPAAPTSKTPKTYKALLKGGTVKDQMYMPRVINQPGKTFVAPANVTDENPQNTSSAKP